MKYIISISIFIILNIHVDAQNSDIDILLKTSKQNTNIITMDTNRTINPLLSMLKFYKSHISKQISADCAFEPSCSVFSFQCIKHIGFFRGILLTADRLSRCNEESILLSPQHKIISNNISDLYEIYR